jgi:hypothetical protein
LVRHPPSCGWSLYGAPWLQPTAISGKSFRPANRKNRPNPLPPAATGCLRRSMVRRGSTVRVRQRALQKRRKSGLSPSAELARAPVCGGYGAVHGAFSSETLLDGLTAACAIAFLRRAVAWFDEHGVDVRAVMTDNGSAYVAHASGPPSPSSTSASCGSVPTGHATTARPSASSRRCSTNAPTPAPRQLRRTHLSAAALPRALQLPTTTRLPRQTASGHKAEQPRWELHLGR